jgi:hypothetical protein
MGALKFRSSEKPSVVLLNTEIDKCGAKCELVVKGHSIGCKEKFLDRIFTLILLMRLHRRTPPSAFQIG